MTSATWAELFVVLTYPIIIGIVLTQTGIAGTEEHGEEKVVAEESAAPAEGGAPSSDLAITAASLAWDEDTLAASAGEPLTITVENEDTTVHNFSIYEDDSLAKELYIGEDAPPNGSVEEKVDPLKKGEYYFQCDYHPSMNGSLVVE
jgi:plastocyanin